MSFASKERERLAVLLIESGPDAPTLNEGWDTADLAAHLYLREHKPLAAAGMFLPPLEGALGRETKKIKARPYTDVVRAWAAGPPALLRPFDAVMNTAENFLHHEDVRRGAGEVRPRDFSAATNRELLRLAARFAKMTLKSAPAPVILTPPNNPPVTVGDKAGVAERGDAVLRVSGEPGELLLWVSGRDAAEVELHGAVEAFRNFDRSL